MLEAKEVCKTLTADCRIFHFGSLSLTDKPAASAKKAAVSYAKQEGKLISFDPNLWESLWDDLELAKAVVWYGI